ncbi:hypothetical protein NGTWS1803_29040 [Mycolicibacterium cyprinidarum]|nr:hypothetical protein NGTWS1803_29040 [Mycolicibacterium sp. NGTWS1803]
MSSLNQYFGYPKYPLRAILISMSTAEEFIEAVTRPASTVSIAGVPWPVYKVVALLIGLIVFAIVAVVTGTAAPAVLSGASVGALAWLGLGAIGSSNH